jgi:hypothetical protein
MPRQANRKKSRVHASFLSPLRRMFPHVEVIPLDKRGREIPSSVRVSVNLDYYSIEEAERIAFSL